MRARAFVAQGGLAIRTAVAIAALLSMGHVGSPDTFFTGHAGPYPVRVTVRLPGAIPGLAQVAVRLPGVSPDAVHQVGVQAIQWDLGPAGAPPPDVARAVPGDRELYGADLWLMVATSYRVHVVVGGRDGKGTAVVPVLALATAQKAMPRALGFTLAGLGIFLAAGLLTIIGAATRESTIAPGSTPGARDRRRARVSMTVAAGALAMVAWGGWAWWNAEALGYAQFTLYRPFTSEAAVASDGGRQTLTLNIRDRRWPPPAGNIRTRYNALMPDHGKLMHLFLVREPALDAFAHVHPVPTTAAADAFDVVLPPLPAGRYRVYGDIVHDSGYAQTLVSSATLSEPVQTVQAGDPDDSWLAAKAIDEGASPVFTAADGSTIAWDRGSEPIVARQERLLTFRARGPDGLPASLEPYMGMLGHAAVASEDGSVFAHLHPSGSISMAALHKFQAGVGTSVSHAMHGAPIASEVTIPYGFPKAGRYRLWVQMKRAGRIVTAAFAVTVGAEGPEVR